MQQLHYICLHSISTSVCVETATGLHLIQSYQTHWSAICHTLFFSSVLSHPWTRPPTPGTSAEPLLSSVTSLIQVTGCSPCCALGSFVDPLNLGLTDSGKVYFPQKDVPWVDSMTCLIVLEYGYSFLINGTLVVSFPNCKFNLIVQLIFIHLTVISSTFFLFNLVICSCVYWLFSSICVFSMHSDN